MDPSSQIYHVQPEAAPYRNDELREPSVMSGLLWVHSAGLGSLHERFRAVTNFPRVGLIEVIQIPTMEAE